MREFHAAWKLLGLKGSATEVDRAFYQVDSNNSGRIDIDEFVNAVKNNRAAELSMSLIFEQMDGELEGLEGIFDEYKKKQEESRIRFQKTTLRRRMMKKQFDLNIRKQTKVLKTCLEDLLNERDENVNKEEAAFYERLIDVTFF